MVESSDWADWANTDAGGVWWQTPRPPGREAMQSLPRQMVELPFRRIAVTPVVSLWKVANVVHAAHVVVQRTVLDTVKRLIGRNTKRFA